jgi:hypothetical protein
MPLRRACQADPSLIIAPPCRADGRVQAALAQLVEHRIRNAGVTGSSPVGGTIFSA